MLLKNTGKRLITIHGGDKSYRILPGHNPSVNVPYELCTKAFAKALIENGELTAMSEPDPIEPESEYLSMSKSDLVALCELNGIEVVDRDTVKILISKLEKFEADQDQE